MRKNLLSSIVLGISLGGCSPYEKQEIPVSSENREISLPYEKQEIPAFWRGVRTETDYQRPVHNKNSPLIHGSELTRVTSDDLRYRLEGVIIHGEPFYIRENIYQEKDEMPIYFIRRGDHDRILDPNNPEVEINSFYIYIPRTVKIKGEPTKGVLLENEGPYGIKPYLTNLNTENIQTGKFAETERDLLFPDIRTITIPFPDGSKRELYVPRVTDEELEELALPFKILTRKIVYRDGKEENPTHMKINYFYSNGRIELITHRGGVFRPERVLFIDYLNREKIRKEEREREELNEMFKYNNPGRGKDIP